MTLPAEVGDIFLPRYTRQRKKYPVRKSQFEPLQLLARIIIP